MPKKDNDLVPESTDEPVQNKKGLFAGRIGTKAVVIAVVAIAVLALLAIIITGTGSGRVQRGRPLGGSLNGTPVYMSPAEAQVLIGPLSGYYTNDLFNYSSPVNATLIEDITPIASGNVSEGWVSVALGSNGTSNQSVEFIVMKSENASGLYSSMASSIEQAYNTTTQSGSVGGFNYTYELLENSTGTFQAVVGWNGNSTVLVSMISNHGYSVNQSMAESFASQAAG